jgi:DNA repair exonuclease SbcCD nuclease subunit
MDAFSQWREINPDRIVFTGDLVHSKNQMTPELVEFIAWVLTECSKMAKTILIPGNHDFLENNMERLDALTPVVDSLKNDNIVYYKNRGVYQDENIDWCVYSLMDHNIPPDIEKSDRVKTGLFHGPVQGLTTNLGFKFEDGFESSKFAGCDLVLCGDIHKRQQFTLPNGGKAVMVGSLIQQNFGETVKHHGYGIYDVETNEYTFHDLDNEQPFLHFSINDIKDIEDGKETHVNLG